MSNLNALNNVLKYIIIYVALNGCHSGNQNFIKGSAANAIKLTDTSPIKKNTGKQEIFDKNHKLSNTSSYQNGVKNGPSINYFPSGQISDSGFYHEGLASGNWMFFNENGQKIYSTYFYQNLEYGPQCWFVNNEIHKFEFLSFDKTSLALIIYNNPDKFEKVYYFSMDTHILPKNDQGVDLFAYLPKIPNSIQNFAIGIAKDQVKKELFPVRGFDFLVDTLLNSPPTGWNYYISCHVQDKVGSYNEIFVEEVIVKKD
jgi:hypothetical protein